MLARLEIEKRRKGWHWRLRAGNNRIIAIGGEPFSSHAAAVRAFQTVRRTIHREFFYGLDRKGAK